MFNIRFRSADAFSEMLNVSLSVVNRTILVLVDEKEASITSICWDLHGVINRHIRTFATLLIG